MKAIVSPPSTSRIGYGIRTNCAATRRSSPAARSTARTALSPLVKSMSTPAVTRASVARASARRPGGRPARLRRPQRALQLFGLLADQRRRVRELLLARRRRREPQRAVGLQRGGQLVEPGADAP